MVGNHGEWDTSQGVVEEEEGTCHEGVVEGTYLDASGVEVGTFLKGEGTCLHVEEVVDSIQEGNLGWDDSYFSI